MKQKNFIGILFRYLILLALGLGNLAVFYLVFTPLTIYPVYWIALLFDGNAVLLDGNLLFFAGNYTEIIPACIAGAAYYLLAILNLSTPMRLDKRIKSLLFLFVGFLAANVIRILIFLGLFASGFEYFDYAHLIVWYLGSTAFVVALWFANVRILKIKEIPIYEDFRRVVRELKK